MAVERKYERDIDLLLAEEFFGFSSLRQLVPDEDLFRGISAKVVDVFVSQSDTDGESDLVVLFGATDGERFALFIEDKIDAPFMPQQHMRFMSEGPKQDGRGGEFDRFEVMLCAPLAYEETSEEAKLFQTFVSYEDISAAIAHLDATPRGEYRARFLATAARRAANNWRHVDDPLTNEFWRQAYTLAMREFPVLEMKEPKYSKGSAWIWFRPSDFPNAPRQVRLELKGQQGRVDLVFPKTDGVRFAAAVSQHLPDPMIAAKAGSTAVVRLRSEPFRIADGVEECLPKIRVAFEAATKLIAYYRANRAFLDQSAEAAASG